MFKNDFKNPTDNTGYMPLKRHIALSVTAKCKKTDDSTKIEK